MHGWLMDVRGSQENGHRRKGLNSCKIAPEFHGNRLMEGEETGMA